MNKLKRQMFKWIDPTIVAKKLVDNYGEPGLIWLDSDGSPKGRWIILAANPIEEICSRGLPSDQSAYNPFDLLRQINSGHWTGWLGYEAGAWVEPKNPWKRSPMATLWFARHDPVIKFDLHKHQVWLEGDNQKRFKNIEKLLEDIEMNQSTSPKVIQLNRFKGIHKDKWSWLTNQKEFAEKVAVLKTYIESGDIFQANLSACCHTKKNKDILSIDLFLRLRQYCPAPFSGLIVAKGKANGEAIISSSPERFLKVTPNKTVETRPIKGTRPRNTNPNIDSELAADLVTSNKDRAENIMIVDLLRNDIGKVCQPGTIEVTELLGLESYSKVHHLTSAIQGQLKPTKTWVDLLEACWPGGSITGAPKIRACQRLHELEPIARGPYCGSLLHLDWNGEFDSNILIRSLMIDQSNLRVHAGCGIVADSEPLNEAEELEWKIMPLLKALE